MTEYKKKPETEEEKKKMLSDSLVEAVSKRRKKVILVAEDEFHVREIVRINLEMEGYKVLVAGNGKEALDLISHELPDLVITDVMMPEMDGMEFFLTLKEKKETNNIPVIMLTVKSQFEDIKSASILGVDEYMTKPFDPRDLNERVKKILKKNN